MSTSGLPRPGTKTIRVTLPVSRSGPLPIIELGGIGGIGTTTGVGRIWDALIPLLTLTSFLRSRRQIRTLRVAKPIATRIMRRIVPSITGSLITQKKKYLAISRRSSIGTLHEEDQVAVPRCDLVLLE